MIGKAIAEAVITLNPFGREGYERRARNKAYRKALRKKRRGEELTQEEQAIMAEKTVVLTAPDGTTIEHTPPLVPLRTATKATMGTAILGYPLIDIVQAIQGAQIPIEWLENFTNGPVFEWLCYSIVPIVIARITKSPLAKQAL